MILDTLEAKNRSIVVQGQPKQILHETPSPAKPEQARHQWLMPVILATQEAEIRRLTVQSQPRQIVCKTLSQKCPTQNMVSRVDQVVEHPPSKHEVLSSNSSATEINK
jgi:hypothetical protein